MRKHRRTFIVTIVMGLLAGSALGVTAQDQEPSAASFFTGDAGEGYRAERYVGWDESSETRDDGVVIGAGSSSVLWQTNDPRIDGWATYVGTEVDYREGALSDSPTGLDGVVRAYLTRVVNDAGAWEGTLVSFQMDDVALDMTTGWLVGEGAYEGLMAYVAIDFTTADCCVINGNITPEGRPPVPETFPEG